jgi:hypothetical protein
MTSDEWKDEAKTFTTVKLKCLDGAMYDHSLPPVARVVAYCIMQHVNSETMEAFPSLQRIMDVTGFGKHSTTRGIAQLITGRVQWSGAHSIQPVDAANRLPGQSKRPAAS